MARLIAATVTRRFSNDRARPVVVEEYAAETGWNAPAARKRVLDDDAVEDLHRRGITLVRARWRFSTHEFSVHRLREDLQLLQGN